MIQLDERVFLAGMDQSTPAARIPRWRTRMRGAWIISANGQQVKSITEVYQVVHSAVKEKK